MRIVYLVFCFLLSNIALADWVDMNTGIDDDFTGVVFFGDNGVVSCNNGLYYTTTGGIGPESWTRFNILGNSTDSLIYNQTRFNHCYGKYYGSGTNKVYACGQDSINGTSIIMYLYFSDLLEYSIFHIGPSGSSLNKIGFSSYNQDFYAVGDNGLIINFDNNAASIVDTNLEYDLLSIDFYSSHFWIGANGVEIFGELEYSNFNYTVDPAPSNFYKDVIYPHPSNSYAVGNGYFFANSNGVTEYTHYDFGPLNGNCIIRKNDHNFVGTDHGIFRTPDEYDVLEWQPSSNNYFINEFWGHPNNSNSLYACGNDGVLLKTDDLGGISKPYVSLSLEGGCEQSGILLGGETGSSTSCSWYVNDEFVHYGCNDFYHTFDTSGIYAIQVNVNNGSGLGDTAIQEIQIVDIPGINKFVTVSDDILCHEEPIIIMIDSSEFDVFYTLRKHGSSGEYGYSDPGNNGAISFTSVPLNLEGDYYLEAKSTIAACSINFTDTILIDVERTTANFHVGLINVIPGESVNFYENCAEAQNFKWRFYPNAFDSISSLPDPVNIFSSIGATEAKLVCWSDNGCYDSIVQAGPTVYAEPAFIDTCWTNVNNGVDPEWSGYYYPDIAQISNSKNGYLTCGFFSEMFFATQHGIPPNLDGMSGGYMMKHNSDGVVKWMVHTPQTTSTRENVKSIVEDEYGNIYICGNGKRSFVDNAGDSTDIRGTGNYYFYNYIIKLDSIGRKEWILTSGNNMKPTMLLLDKSNNLIVAANISYQDIPISFNGVPTDTIARTSPDCNYTILKISPEGAILWDAGIELGDNNGAEITKFGTDTADFIYLTGYFWHDAMFYSTDSLTGHSIDNGPGHQTYLVKYNEDGVFQWKLRSATVGSSSDNIIARDMVTDSIGNCYISGSNMCNSYNSYSHIFENTDGSITSINGGEYFIAKVNPEGICQWIQAEEFSYYGYGYNVLLDNNEVSVLGQIANNDAVPETAEFTSANNHTITITIDKGDYFVAVYDTSGNLLRIHKNGENGNLLAHSGFSGLLKSNDGCYYAARNLLFFNGANNYMDFGTLIPGANGIDGLVTKFRGECGISYYPPPPIDIQFTEAGNRFRVFPNPVKNELTVLGLGQINNPSVQIVNSMGKSLLTTFEDRPIDVGNLPSGLYFVLVFDNDILCFKEKIIVK